MICKLVLVFLLLVLSANAQAWLREMGDERRKAEEFPADEDIFGSDYFATLNISSYVSLFLREDYPPPHKDGGYWQKEFGEMFADCTEEIKEKESRQSLDEFWETLKLREEEY